MTGATRTRLLAVVAAVAITAAAVVLEGRQTESDTRMVQPSATAATPVATSSPPATGTPTPTPTASGVDSAALRAARAYALTATNWSARTYRAAYRRQLRLAAPRLRHQLRRTRPTAMQLTQLAADRDSRLGAILAARAGDPERPGWAGRARVLVEVDELHIAAGRRESQVVTYRADLVHRRDGWRVSSFGAKRGRP